MHRLESMQRLFLMDLRIERLTVEEGSRLRTIRLRALRDSPDAFGATFEEANARPEENWSQQVRDLPTFVAVHNGVDIGMVRCARPSTDTSSASLISMWVAPEFRRLGVGTALVTPSSDGPVPPAPSESCSM